MTAAPATVPAGASAAMPVHRATAMEAADMTATAAVPTCLRTRICGCSGTGNRQGRQYNCRFSKHRLSPL
jgi:hypothetical protein